MYRRYRSDNRIDASATSGEIKARKVPEGYVLEVTHMMCCNYNRVNLQIAIGYLDNSQSKHYLLFKYSTYRNAAILRGEAWIEAGEQPFGEVISPTTDDDIYLSVHGKLWPKELWRAKGAEVQQEDTVPD